jgi:hypothetical protein
MHRDPAWKSWLLLLCAAYALAAACGLERSPNWDEVWLLGHARRPWADQLAAVRHDLAHPPLPYVLMRACFYLAGPYESAPKVLIAGINLATIALFTWLAAGWLREWRMVSLLHSAIYLQIGSVPTLIRGYGLLMLAVVSAVAFWRRWRTSNQDRWLIGWALAITIAGYCHYFGFLLLGGFVAAVLLAGPRRWSFALACALPIVAILPWLIFVWRTYSAQAGVIPSSLDWVTNRGILGSLIDLPVDLLTYVEGGSDPFGRPSPIAGERVHRGLVLAVWGVHAGLAAVLAVRWRSWLRAEETAVTREVCALLVILAAPAVALVGLSWAVAPLLHPRFLVGILPVYWLALGAVVGVAGVAARALVIIGLLPIVLGSSLAVSFERRCPSELRVLARGVAEEYRKGDALVADSIIGEHVLWEWTGVQRRDEALRIFRATAPGDKPFRELRGQNFVPYLDLDRIVDDVATRAWLFYANPEQRARATRQFESKGFREVGGLLDFGPGVAGVMLLVREREIAAPGSHSLQPRSTTIVTPAPSIE